MKRIIKASAVSTRNAAGRASIRRRLEFVAEDGKSIDRRGLRPQHLRPQADRERPCRLDGVQFLRGEISLRTNPDTGRFWFAPVRSLEAFKVRSRVLPGLLQ